MPKLKEIELLSRKEAKTQKENALHALAQVKQNEINQMNALVDLAEQQDIALTAVELTQKSNGFFTKHEIAGNLCMAGKTGSYKSRFPRLIGANTLLERPPKILKQRRYIEIDGNGEIINGGHILNRIYRLNIYGTPSAIDNFLKKDTK